jgi:hypothetical protein
MKTLLIKNARVLVTMDEHAAKLPTARSSSVIM